MSGYFPQKKPKDPLPDPSSKEDESWPFKEQMKGIKEYHKDLKGLNLEEEDSLVVVEVILG